MSRSSVGMASTETLLSGVEICSALARLSAGPPGSFRSDRACPPPRGAARVVTKRASAQQTSSRVCAATGFSRIPTKEQGCPA
jgi:hypothetical protein